MACPAAILRGTPAVIPTIATVVACQNTISATWRRMKPSAFSTPLSVRRRDTLTTIRYASAAVPHSASTAGRGKAERRLQAGLPAAAPHEQEVVDGYTCLLVGEEPVVWGGEPEGDIPHA
jgi:hypothetical protein